MNNLDDTPTPDRIQRTTPLVSGFGWFEDFSVGQRIRHPRSTTVDEVEGSQIAKQVMNTAEGHWNDHTYTGLGEGRVVFGLATASIIFGLSSQDCAEHALRELGVDRLRFSSPVHHGDTLTAYTEVLATEPSDREDAGVVTFQHWGVNHKDVRVFEGTRTVLIKRASHWQ